MFKRKKFLNKLVAHWYGWNTEQYDRTHITKDGRLILTNNIDIGEFSLTKGDMGLMIQVIKNNT